MWLCIKGIFQNLIDSWKMGLVLFISLLLFVWKISWTTWFLLCGKKLTLRCQLYSLAFYACMYKVPLSLYSLSHLHFHNNLYMRQFNTKSQNNYLQTHLLKIIFQILHAYITLFLFLFHSHMLINSSEFILWLLASLLVFKFRKIITEALGSCDILDSVGDGKRLQWLHLCPVPVISDRNFPILTSNSDWVLSPQTFITFTL